MPRLVTWIIYHYTYGLEHVISRNTIFHISHSELVQKLIENFQEIPEILQKYPGCKLTFLEIPHYSISEWNKSHKLPDIYIDSPSVARGFLR